MMNSPLIRFAEAKLLWAMEKGRWPNFVVGEVSCTCCGEVCWEPEQFDVMQRLRTRLARPTSYNSVHRCFRNNARVGGAPKSMHKLNAFDFSLLRPVVTIAELRLLKSLAQEAGWRTFGVYSSFIHMDRRPGRFWVTPSGEKYREYFDPKIIIPPNSPQYDAQQSA